MKLLEPAVHGVVGAGGERDDLTNMVTFISLSQLALSEKCVSGCATPSERYPQVEDHHQNFTRPQK